MKKNDENLVKVEVSQDEKLVIEYSYEFNKVIFLILNTLKLISRLLELMTLTKHCVVLIISTAHVPLSAHCKTNYQFVEGVVFSIHCQWRLAKLILRTVLRLLKVGQFTKTATIE